MSEFHGQFCWCELMTTDDVAATAFYCDVIGWQSRDAGAAHVRYTVLNVGETGIGGIVTLPQSACAAGARPFWIGYIAVDYVDGSAGRVTQLGGSAHRPAENIPDIGRFAVVAGPHGALFTLFKPNPSDQAPKPLPAVNGTPGHVGWHELHAGDHEAALSFYADLFGWAKTDAVHLGPMGTYQTFASGGDSATSIAGGMMKRLDAFPAPIWLHYFNVHDIEPAATRTKSAGGEILMGPHQIPGGSRIAQCRDKQGALFAMIGPRL